MPAGSTSGVSFRTFPLQRTYTPTLLFVPTKVCVIRSIFTARDLRHNLDSSMLVATCSFSKQIRLYKVEVDWSGRSFAIEHVKIIPDCSSHNQDAGEGGMAAGLPYPEAQLYHLELVSPAPDIRSKEDFPPLLLGFFCNSPPRENHPLMEHGPLTSIVRWEMASIKPTLHPGFSQLASKRSNASKPSELQVLRDMGPIESS